MISATLDVNVLVSAAISPRGIPRQIVASWLTGGFGHVTSEHIVDHLVRKLRTDR